MVTTKEKLEGFIDKLESLRYEIEPVSKKPQVYRIDGELVNIRSRSRIDQRTRGRRLWYSVSFSVLQEVKWIIYLTTDSDHFIMLRSRFLDNLRDRMLPDSKNAGVGVFDIDWDNQFIVIKDGKLEPIEEYYYDLSDPRYYPSF